MPLIKHDEWYERRKNGIGGSEAAVVLGISPFKSPLRLWLEKRGEIEAEDIGANEPVYWGTKLEGLIAEEYSNRTGREVVESAILAVHKQYPWMICNVDRWVMPRSLKLILEIKNTSIWAARASEWGPDGTSQVPPYYFTQAQHNCEVTGARQCDMPILIGGNDYRCYHIPHDPAFCDYLIKAEMAFMESLKTGVKPEPICDDDLKLLFPSHVKGLHVEATEEIGKAWGTLVQIAPHLKALQKQVRELRFKIAKHMGEAEFLSDGGTDMATYRKSPKSGRRTLRIISKGLDFGDDESC